MISKETSARMWNCHREIEVAKTLLTELGDALRNGHDPNPLDAFGEPRPYQLGVPSGDNSHRLYNVAPRLALSVMRAHIAEKERELVEANEQARIEIDTFSVREENNGRT